MVIFLKFATFIYLCDICLFIGIMKSKIIFLLTTVLMFSVLSFAQEQYRIQTIDGVEYYVYSVKQSEGLYRISVNFGVSQDEIIKFNPEVKDGLKAGQIIFIPKKKGIVSKVVVPEISTMNGSSQQQQKSERAAPPVDIIAATMGGGSNNAIVEKKEPKTFQKIELMGSEPHFYYHKVEKRQTLYSLSRQYGVAQEDVIKYNPQTASGLRDGDVLRIPKPEDIYVEKKAEKMQEDLSVKYLIHKVEHKETLYSISKKYDVKQEDIEKLNSELEILSIDQELKIPYYAALITTDTVNGKATTYLDLDKIFGKADALEIHKLRIAFLLPFMLENKNNPNDGRFVDFYGGAVKAISEAKENGISVDIYTYDTGRTRENMEEVFANNSILQEVDLIIGPAYSVQVPVATEFAKKNQIKTLIPFTSRILGVEFNPYVFQFNPGMDVELDFLKQMFETKFDDANYIFADIEYVPDVDEGAIISKNLKRIFDEQERKYTTLSIPSPEVNLFDSAVVHSKKNFVIFNTDQFQVVQPYFENLNRTDRRHDLIMLERYNWKNQESYRPVGVYVAPFKSEYEMFDLNQYNRDFVNLFGWEAATNTPRYDVLAYDLVSYFVGMLNDKEKNIMTELELDMYWQGTQSQFQFKRKSLDSGFVNHRVYLGESQIK